LSIISWASFRSQTFLPRTVTNVFWCQKLVRYNAALTSFPNSTEYISELAGYWVLQNREFYLSCRFSPLPASDVSFTVRIIVEENCPFTTLSGRHSFVAGANNVPDGVTIDLNTHMRSIKLDE
jgi:hypothetical protein